ncbi:MAG: hypothetical protein Q7K11_00140 [Candidatus Berkelbacteria bacterium]|nr:hypothetical protein [Candidatus Berkelbacteria bacterium]
MIRRVVILWAVVMVVMIFHTILHEQAHVLAGLIVGISSSVEYDHWFLGGMTILSSANITPGEYIFISAGPTLFLYMPAFVGMIVAWKRGCSKVMFFLSIIVLDGALYMLGDSFFSGLNNGNGDYAKIGQWISASTPLPAITVGLVGGIFILFAFGLFCMSCVKILEK